MKAIIITISLLVIMTALLSNPIMPMVMSEVWFTDSGHCMVEFYPWILTISADTVLFFINGDVQEPFYYNFSALPQDSVLVVDITEEIPNISFNQAEDGMSIGIPSTSGLFVLEGFSWGDSFNNSINPPLPGQSMVQGYNNYYDEFQHWAWYKSQSPTPGCTGGIDIDTVIVVVTNQFGEPVPKVPIYDYNEFAYSDSTDFDGKFTTTMLAGRYKLKVLHPESNIVVHDQLYWLEPNQTTTIPIQINLTANEDNTAPVMPKTGLKAYPSPFNIKTADAVSFQYNGSSKLRGESVIRIYDIKGRYISSVSMSAKGTASWKPNRDIGSGIYFARLISGNRILDTATISIIK